MKNLVYIWKMIKESLASFYTNRINSCLDISHGETWMSGGMAPLVLNFGTTKR
jgi:hypothetical protein